MILKVKAATVGAGAALETQSAGQRIKFARAILAQPQPILPRKITNKPISNVPSTCARWPCRRVAIAIHVVALGGAQQQLCRRCWRAARELERVEVARRKLDALFCSSRPQAQLGLGGGVVAVRAALIGVADCGQSMAEREAKSMRLLTQLEQDGRRAA
jgi:hypothetical protein